MSEHTVTTADTTVRGHPGSISQCTCGWLSSWCVRDGSAEEDGHQHRMTNDFEYRTEYQERVKKSADEDLAKGCLCKHFTDSFGYLVNQDCPMHGVKRKSQAPKPHPDQGRCHPCSCHDHPPCGQCENCKHFDNPECPNDCQECEEHDEHQ